MKFVQRLMLVGFLVSVTVFTAACAKKTVTQDEKLPVAIEAEEKKQQEAVEAEEIEQLAALETEEMKRLAALEAEEKERQAAVEAEEKKRQAAVEAEERERQAAVEAEEKERQAAVEAEEKKRQAAVEAEERERQAAIEAEKKKLKATLELWDGQEGIVGMLGYVWTIEPSGSWRVAHFVNNQIGKPQDNGQLTPEELVFLNEVLESQSFGDLPSRIHVGNLLAVSARMIDLNFVDLKEATLFFKAGEPLQRPSSVKMRITLNRFVKIVNTIKQLTNGGYARAGADPGTIDLATAK
jgi:chemotaxis protein histidine kinase CheA